MNFIDNDGLSPVIGIILLTAITVALVSLAAFFVFDVGQSADNDVGSATVTAEYESESKINVQLLKRQGADRVIVQSALGTEYTLDTAGETVTLLNQDSNQTPIILGETDGERTVLQSVPPRSFTPDIVVSHQARQGQYTNLSNAISNASDGDIIVLRRDTYYQNIKITTPNVTLVGESGTVIADNGSQTSVVDVEASNVRVSNIAIDASSTNGGTAAEYGLESPYSTELVDTTITGANTSSTTDSVVQVTSDELVPARQLSQSLTNATIPTTLAETWVRKYNATDKDDRGFSVTTTSNDTIIAAGYSKASDGDTDYYIIKYDTKGNKLLSKRDDTGRNDTAQAMTTDSDGNIIVSGRSEGADGQNDYYTVKYDNDGNTIWTRRYDGGGNDRVHAAVATQNDSIVVTGQSKNTTTGNTDYYTIKYSSSGTELWTRRYSSDGKDKARAIAIDNGGNLVVSGASQGSDTTFDYHIIKYATNGDVLWTKRYDSGNPDRARGVAVDTNNNTIITGYTKASDGDYDYQTVKYTNSGDLVWVEKFDSGGNDFAIGMTTDIEDSVYVTGRSDTRLHLIKYSRAGEKEWTERYTDERSFGLSASVTRNGTVYVTGSEETGDLDYLTIKYE